ncbi:glyoxylate/hydroxypyruvate reductase A [Roseomonas sp. SSH11]|uniref:Glyoxylate/hydroxypyruvate reductase A n=1 Tax=Pararoseomonas baculiformis TaxID=2820812 RepID=A0ABS4AGS7_9PROT|nr:glyoxylate/hydroxypyruvate reductase A [Pararoseomonas baculiformis]MBP0446206.1 glyoxylate/hydroxypyruvate reductase A [Pararoseomonas baculiformis]
MLLVKAEGARVRQSWCDLLAEFRPGLVARPYDAPGIRVEDATYALAWEPEPGWLASMPKLRVIFSLGAGVDHITRDPSWPRGVPLVRMGGEETGQRMGEYIAWACLTLLRDGRDHAIAQAERRWAYKVGEDTARDLTVGIMGMGTLGAAAVPMLRGLGYGVVGWSRTRKTVEGAESFAGPEELDAFLARSQVLVCLLPSTPETMGIVDAALLAKLPRGASLVNAARGPHVVLPDLLEALDSGQLSGAVLDVFDPEPLPVDSPLWAHPKVTVTPHVASVARRRERARYVADAIAAFEAGGPLPNLYDPERGY